MKEVIQMPGSALKIGDMEEAITTYTPKKKVKRGKAYGLFSLGFLIAGVYVALLVSSTLKYVLLMLLLIGYFVGKVWGG